MMVIIFLNRYTERERRTTDTLKTEISLMFNFFPLYTLENLDPRELVKRIFFVEELEEDVHKRWRIGTFEFGEVR